MGSSCNCGSNSTVYNTAATVIGNGQQTVYKRWKQVAGIKMDIATMNHPVVYEDSI